jgi:nitrite reductase (NO-forming)
MAEDYLPTGRQVAWLGGLLLAGVLVGAAIGVGIFGAPHLPQGGPPPPPDLTVEVTLAEFSITASPLEIPSGADVEFTVSNDGELQHDFKIAGQTGVERVPPGGRRSFRYGPVTEDVTAWCTIPGHREQGMEITLPLSAASVDA